MARLKAVPGMMASDQWNLTRGLVAAVLTVPLAFALPWLLLNLLFLVSRLGIDLDPSADGAWLASCLLASALGTAAGVSFATTPRSSVWNDFLSVAFAAMVASLLVLLVKAPRVKSDPPFGDTPSDLVLLAAPAVATGLVILAWRAVRESRNGSGTGGPTGPPSPPDTP